MQQQFYHNEMIDQNDLRAADPTFTSRLIDVRTSAAIKKEQEIALMESPAVNWMFLPPRNLSLPISLADVCTSIIYLYLLIHLFIDFFY